jgi:hypothetical protein
MSRTSKLAKALLQDRAERADRKAARTTTTKTGRVIPDKHWFGMYRLRLPDGSLTDMVIATAANERGTG